MNSTVLDSSAILAFLNREPGWERAEAALPDGIVSSLILAEVVTRLTLGGGKPWQVAATWDDLQLLVEPFDAARARAAGFLVDKTRPFGLSLADRACLSLAGELGLPTITADRAWRNVQIGVEIVLIR
ncbi:MAG TPA: type II toxin-antitoxin system VapC family toxin [Xanthobacteraceae bacterium]|nr:type II toxin-antitoxin system VapC family toxin [Xanthobacteraceae bacterium]